MNEIGQRRLPWTQVAKIGWEKRRIWAIWAKINIWAKKLSRIIIDIFESAVDAYADNGWFGYLRASIFHNLSRNWPKSARFSWRNNQIFANLMKTHFDVNEIIFVIFPSQKNVTKLSNWAFERNIGFKCKSRKQIAHAYFSIYIHLSHSASIFKKKFKMQELKMRPIVHLRYFCTSKKRNYAVFSKKNTENIHKMFIFFLVCFRKGELTNWAEKENLIFLV